MNVKNSVKSYDVIIVGGGAAGLYCALNFPTDKNILMLNKGEKLLSNSALAQGGVAAVLSTQNDSFDLHINDTMIAGHHVNNPVSVDILVKEGPDDVRKIAELGVDFDKQPDGSFVSTLEGGHSRNRIVHHKDSTGYEIAEKLMMVAESRDNIEILDNTLLYNLNPIEGGFAASYVRNKKAETVCAPFVVLATGGIGQVYKYTTNSDISTGDGIRFAYELGAKIAHLDYIQFHPTSFAVETGSRQKFLISEAVRGEGAYLLNCHKERFMHLYDERLELAPRDVVAKSIILESRKQQSEKFYLDITYKGEEFIKNRFPMIYSKCLEYGVDITKEPIPVFPCHHYLMGGIDVDINGKTSIDRLYAVGECSHTGVHGQNRLASNSLLEALVFGRRSAEDILAKMKEETFTPPESLETPSIEGAEIPKDLDLTINEIMQRSCFVIPHPETIPEGLRRVDEIRNNLRSGHYAINRELVENLSLATVAHIILKEMEKR